MDCGGALQLPPGFRFHPTDDELVMYYLLRKCGGLPLAAPVIAEVDLYKFDPWQLPEKAYGGEKEWYFFSPRDRKYPNGSRPNRAAGTGYWKATGADKPVGSPRPVAIKKALVFYAGKPPKGVKTNWIMHEYRLADVDRSAAARKKTNNSLRRLIRSSRSKSIRIEYNQAYMAMVPSDSSHHGVVDNSPNGCTQARCDEARKLGPSWYFSRKELEENSPSRRDGIDFKKESNLRKLYCKFLQELGIALKMPQVTIATAMVFCHRFYLRQSLAKNDRRIIATVCLFLAGKVEETPKPLRDVILVSYGMIHKNDPKASQRIKQQKEIYDKQKELILLGERVVLVTLGFDLNIHHAYRPLVEAIRRFNIDNKSPLAQVAWNFVNDGLRTSLCLQFQPHHIAAGAIRLAAKFLKVKLPSDGDKHWWQDFDVTCRQLEDISSQLLEMYEQNRTTQAQSSQGSEAEGSSAGVCNQRSSVKSEANSKEPSAHGYLQASRSQNLQHSSSTSASGHHDDGHSNSDKHISGHKMLQNDNANHGGSKEKNKSGIKSDTGMDRLHHDKKFSPGHRYPVEEHQRHRSDDNSNETRDGVGGIEAPVVSTSRMDAMNKIDKDKVKAALEKRRKSKGGFATKVNLIDDDDLLERELEQGVELAVEVEKIKQDKKQNLSDGSKHPPDLQNTDQVMENGHHVKQSLPTTAEDMGCLMDSKHPSPFDKQNDVPEHKSQQLDDTLKHQKGYDHPQLVGSPEQDGKDYKRPKLDG